MADNASYSKFVRVHKRKWDAFLQFFGQLTSDIASHSPERKLESAKRLLDSLEALVEILDSSDVPEWAGEISKPLKHLLRNPKEITCFHNLSQAMSNASARIRSQQWDFSKGSQNPTLNLDTIFDECWTESQLPELFDRAIHLLEDIIGTGEIDSLNAIRDLNTLIDLIRSNQGGSFIARIQTADFLSRYWRSVAWKFAESMPAVGHFVAGFKEVMDQMDAEAAETVKRAQSKVAVAVPMRGVESEIRRPERLGLPSPGEQTTKSPAGPPAN